MSATEYFRVLVQDVPRFEADVWRWANRFVHLEAPDRAWVWMAHDVADAAESLRL